MTKKLLFLVFFLGVSYVFGQDLHSDSNAVSVSNESNSTAGWTSQGILTVEDVDVQSGNFSFRLVSTDDNGRLLEYSFNAVVGTDYTVRIWAKEGDTSNTPAFANWGGLQGLATTPIVGNTWTEYVFNVTATSPNAIIRIYSSPFSQRFVAGNTVLIDSVSIIADGSDTEAPSAVTSLASSNTTMTSTDLSWNASNDNIGVTNYEVFQDGVSIANTGTAMTLNVTNLTENTSYDFTVLAEDAAGNISLAGNVETVTTLSDTQAPTAVADLASTNITTTTADLSWSASTDNIGVTNYEVFQDGVSIANTGTNTFLNVTGLASETSYNFTVIAEDAAGNLSAVSNTANVTTNSSTDTEAPSAITDLSSSSITSNSTNLTWSPSTDNVGVTNYEVFQDGVTIANTGTTTTLNVTGLTPETSYNFTVIAEDAEGNTSAASNSETVLTLAAPDTESPSAITDFMATNTTSTTTDLSWSASTDNVGVVNYSIFQNGVSIADVDATTFNVTGLSPSTSYDFTVFAEDAAGNISLVSNTETVLTPGLPDTESPTGITDLAASNTTSTATSLSWSASSDNVGVTNYEVFQDGNSIANTGTETSFNVTSLTPNTNYNFTVFAEDAAGNISASSNTASVNTLEGSNIVDYTSENANLSTVDWTAANLFADQAVGIGTTNTQGYSLAVAGNVIAEGVRVELQTNWPDFVFESDYELPRLDEVKAFIAAFGHLPNVPSAKKVEQEGIDLGSMDAKLLQKIEELTLYLISQETAIKELKSENERMKETLKKLEKNIEYNRK